MALFKNKKDPNDAIQPIANKVPIDLTQTNPITGGNSLEVQSILRAMPFNMGQKPQYSEINTKNLHSQEYDDGFTPNLFGSWMDIYEAFMGSYRIISAPPEIKRHQKGMKHLLFISNQLALYKAWDKRYILGNITSTDTDEYGRVIKGTFIPFNYHNAKFNNDNPIIINNKNNHLIATMSLNIYNIPLFIAIKYFIHLRNILYQFKNVNLRLSTINTIVGVKGGGKEILEPFLKDLFNLDGTKFPNPIQILDISANEKTGDLNFNFTDLNNQIKIPVEYKGNDINLDIDSLTKELFRICGLRYDTSASSGTFQDRPSKSQTYQAANYFDARENSILEAFENFSYDCKEKFGFNMKWESIYHIEATEEQNEQKETGEDKNDTNL